MKTFLHFLFALTALVLIIDLIKLFLLVGVVVLGGYVIYRVVRRLHP